MRFGERLNRERWVPWAVHYFNYELLKRKMKVVMAAQEEQEREEAKEDFAKALNTEIEKVTCLLPSSACLSDIPLHAFMMLLIYQHRSVRLKLQLWTLTGHCLLPGEVKCSKGCCHRDTGERAEEHG